MAQTKSNIGSGFMTVQEVADFLRLSRGKVYGMLNAGELPRARIGGRSCRVPRKAVEDFALKAMAGAQ